jgi:multidrug efflux pump subunit AcrB
MKSVIRWAIKNSPAMNTFLIAAMLIGAVSMVVMRREVFPNFALEIVLVAVPFPGATPEETEEGVCQKIESAVANLDGIKKMTSVGRENFGYVILELDNNVSDVQKVLNDVRSAIDQISTFPPNAEDPEVKQIVFRAPAISVGILAPQRDGETTLEDEQRLRAVAEEVRAELLELRPTPPANPIRNALKMLFQPKGPAVSTADIVAAKPFEISVEVSEDNLRKYNLDLQTIARRIRQQNADTPGGTMEIASQELLLRGNNKREIGIGIEELPIKPADNANGEPITVGDIATVIDGFAETSSSHLINGRRGLVIRVSKTAQEDLFTIVETVKEYVSRKELPAGYQISTWGDISVDVRDRMELLTRNGAQGLLLVFIVLACFLELRLAFWVAMGIPVSILAAGFVLLATGQTLNMLTMFSFLMALGIVVDDAIVIGENIYAKREEGLPFVKAAIDGTAEVLPSVIASVATTIIAFMPLLYVTGVMGKFISIMPVAVIAMLVISLVESTFILPAHLAHENNLFMRFVGLVMYIFKPLTGTIAFVNKRATWAMDWAIEKFYSPLLYWSLNNKRIVISSSLALGAFSVGLIMAGIAPFAMMPKMDGREVNATVAFPNGTTEHFSKLAVDELQAAFERIDARIKEETGSSVVQNLYRRVGEVGDGNMGPTGVTNGSHVGSVEVQLVPPSERVHSTTQLNALWRDEVPKISGTEILKFGSPSMGPGGSDIEFKILSDDKGIKYLDQAADDCKVFLAGKLGVSDIEDDSRVGKMEMIIRLNEMGRALGLDESNLASTIRGGYFGEEVMRLQRGRHEVKLMVRYPEKARKNALDFKQIRIRDNQGVERPLMEVADIEQRRAFSEINRIDQRRSVTISASVEKEDANSSDIIAEMKSDFLPKLFQRYKTETGANLAVNWEGEQAQNEESVASMMSGFVVALLCMFVLLTLQFRSYIQPAIILAIIPFGWLGAILGHAVMGLDLTLFSFFGLIALTGVVVNDSIVLVDFINRKVRDGVPLFDALMAAGKRRFRPIMLTSFTTVAGLFPMLLETSLQAQVLIPMACSLIFGLITGTLLILILVPVFYHIYGIILLKTGNPLFHDDDELFSEEEEKDDERFGTEASSRHAEAAMA